MYNKLEVWMKLLDSQTGANSVRWQHYIYMIYIGIYIYIFDNADTVNNSDIIKDHQSIKLIFGLLDL